MPDAPALRAQLLQDTPTPWGVTLPRGLRLPIVRPLLAGAVAVRVPPAYAPGKETIHTLACHQYRRVP